MRSSISEGAGKYFFAQNQDIEPEITFCRELCEAQTPSEQGAELEHRSLCLSEREGREALTPDWQFSLILSTSAAQSLCSSQRNVVFNPLFGNIFFWKGTGACYLLLKSKPFPQFGAVVVITIASGGGLTLTGSWAPTQSLYHFPTGGWGRKTEGQRVKKTSWVEVKTA